MLSLCLVLAHNPGTAAVLLDVLLSVADVLMACALRLAALNKARAADMRREFKLSGSYNPFPRQVSIPSAKVTACIITGPTTTE